MPPTWEIYGVDANDDGVKDPYNPVDAIFAAAKYLKAAGGDKDIQQGDLRLQPRSVVRRPGHAPRQADRRRARPADRLAHRSHRGPLPRSPRRLTPTHLTEARARRATAKAPQRCTCGSGSGPSQRHQDLLEARRSGHRRPGRGRSGDRPQHQGRQLHRHPGHLRQPLPLPQPRLALEALPGAAPQGDRSDFKLPAPTQDRRRPPRRAPSTPAVRGARAKTAHAGGSGTRRSTRERSASTPTRTARAPRPADRRRQPPPTAASRCPATKPSTTTSRSPYGLKKEDVVLKPLKDGSHVIGGTILGRYGVNADGRTPFTQLPGPPGRQRRAGDRPEADPRRLEAARADRDLPRRRRQPAVPASGTSRSARSS